jgi:tripartite-type tricarboxylate transporter receptor subunit TctC
MERLVTRIPLFLAALAGPAFAAQCAAAETAAEFYKDAKTITLIVSAGVGGGYSAYARTFARHMGDHMPGNPSIVVQNMPGGGGLRATNYLYNVAPKDGSVLGLVHSSVPLAPLYEIKAAKFDASKFNWIGSMNQASGICVFWHSAPIKTWHDLLTKPSIVGGTGAGSQMETLPAMLNAIFGTRIKIISGYKGGNEVYLAMERGEVQGRCGGLKSSIRSTRPDWFPNHKVVVPIQIAERRDPDFPDAPTVMELAKNDRDRAILKLALAPDHMDRPVLAPPGVPADRVSLLRKAFMATMKDPKFEAEAAKQHLETDYCDGATVAKLLDEAYATPRDIVQAAAEDLKPKTSDRTVRAGAGKTKGKKTAD